MQNIHRTRLFLLAFGFALTALPTVAQVVIATVPAQGYPAGVAVNSVTNKIYVTDACGNDLTCKTFNGTVTVIDGATLSTVSVPVGSSLGPNGLEAVAVNSMANKIYVVNGCGSDPTCQSNGKVTVIAGATNNTTSVNVGYGSFAGGGQLGDQQDLCDKLRQ